MAMAPPVQAPWIQTPLVESKPLSEAVGCRVFLKLENLQPGTSFKSRGIGNLMLSLIQEAKKSESQKPLHFYISSGGNAGLACVTAAKTLGYKSTVVLPTSTEEAMLVRLRAAGAENVISHGPSWAFADQHLRQVVIPAAESKGEIAIYCPPFDHPAVWQGNSTIIDEIQAQMPDKSIPDAVICSVGGGGLFSGLMHGIDRANWQNHIRVLAVETLGADSLCQSITSNKLITLPGITSIATSLGAVRVAEEAYKQAQRPHVKCVVLEDAEAAMGAWRFADDERILVEPACGVSVALAYDGRMKTHLSNLTKDSKIVIIVCGGCRVSLADLQHWKEKYLPRADELSALARQHAIDLGLGADVSIDGAEVEGNVPSSVTS